VKTEQQKLGQQGEDLAAQYLQAQGYRLIGANYRIRTGEIDLITREKETLVFVEVKSRKSQKFGNPLESIDQIKLQKLIKVALTYVREYNWSGPFRIDVIGIDWNAPNGPKIQHLKNALS
jgi:putative endonuclease